MATETLGAPSPTTSTATRTWYLPVLACRRGDYRDSLGGALKFLDTYWHLWDPDVSLRFVAAWSGQAISVGYEVSASSSDYAHRASRDIKAVLTGCQQRLTIAEPTSDQPWPTPGPLACEFEARGNPDRIISERSLLFGPSPTSDSQFHLVVDLLTPSDPAGRPSPSDRPFPGGDDPATDRRNLVTVTLHARAQAWRAIAALLAADSSDDGYLQPVPPSDGTVPLPRAMPPQLVAHLLALPGRVGDLLPERAPDHHQTLFTTLAETPTPHVLALGASGQGKTTCLAAIGQHALQAGRAVVAVDVHDGQLVRTLYQQALAASRPALHVDLDPSLDTPATLPLWLRPPGVPIERHIDEQFDILRNDAWADSDPDWWGPVGTRLSRAGIALTVTDPAHCFGLSQLPRLLDPTEQDFRDETLDRIGNLSLTRLVNNEIMPMVAAPHADNAMTWVLSKFEPFAAPQVAGILEGNTARVPVDEAMTRGYSLFVHVPIGRLGAVPARMIAGLIVHRAFAALTRGRLPHPVDFIQDEYHLYASSLTSRMLAESRKFGARLILANQNLAQLPRQLRDSVLGNTGAVACYRLNPADALLVDGLFPTLPIRTLQTLPPHTIALTTFARDTVLAGPTPLPDTTEEPPAWGDQLATFWDGDEPDLTEPCPTARCRTSGTTRQDLDLDWLTA